MILEIICIIVIAACMFFNGVVSCTYTTERMREELFNEQCIVGKIGASILYAPAWVLKFVKYFVVKVIK